MWVGHEPTNCGGRGRGRKRAEAADWGRIMELLNRAGGPREENGYNLCGSNLIASVIFLSRAQQYCQRELQADSI